MLSHRAFCEGPLSSVLVGTETVTQALTVRFATQSFVTRSTDSPAHDFIEGRVSRGLELGRQITLPAGQPFGALFESGTGPNFGEIELLNLDGTLDSLVEEYFADGRPIRLKIGSTEIDQFGREKVKPYSTFALVYTAIAGEWRFEHDHVRLVVRNQADRLQDRLQRRTYAGTGGKQGTADMLGRTLPTAFGRCLNITAQLVDPNVFSYQLHAGKIDSITAVYDAGIVVPFEADYPTYDDLVATSISAGEYGSCLQEGFIRLGTAPVGDVTADIRGHRTSAAEGNLYLDEHGGVMKRILLDYSDLASTDIDLLSFDVLDGVQPESMGIFLPAGDTSTIEEVLERIASSCGAFIGQDRTGLLRTARLEAPKSTQDWTFDGRDILSIEQVSLPYRVPWKAWGIGYQTNWTVQKRIELAAGVSESRRRFLESEQRFVYVQDSSIALAHRTSSGFTKPCLFSARTGAEAEAQRLIELYSIGRAMYRVTVKNALFSVEIGQTVRLIYDRWNLAGGQNFVVLGVADNADTVETELLLFGSGDTIDYDYDVKAALQARQDSNMNYFTSVLPSAVLSTGVIPEAPAAPSQRGWTALTYPPLSSSDIGQQAKAVLVTPAYPLSGSWSDPNPSTNTVAAYIGAAPDGTTAIEIRYTTTQSLQSVDAFIPFITTVTLPGVQGARHIGAKMEVWTQSGFNWGSAGGKVAGGIWGGNRASTSLVTPWGTQNGISLRNIWGVSSGAVNARLYGYILNRPLAEGVKTANVPNRWKTGRWQLLEYEGRINTPGVADGYARFWIDSECVGEILNAVWALASEFIWRGILISDAWDGTVPQNQKRWIRNLTVYVP